MTTTTDTTFESARYKARHTGREWLIRPRFSALNNRIIAYIGELVTEPGEDPTTYEGSDLHDLVRQIDRHKHTP